MGQKHMEAFRSWKKDPITIGFVFDYSQFLRTTQRCTLLFFRDRPRITFSSWSLFSSVRTKLHYCNCSVSCLTHPSTPQLGINEKKQTLSRHTSCSPRISTTLSSHKVVIIIPCLLVFAFALELVSMLALATCPFFCTHTFNLSRRHYCCLSVSATLAVNVGALFTCMCQTCSRSFFSKQVCLRPLSMRVPMFLIRVMYIFNKHNVVFFRARVNECGNVVGLNQIVCVSSQADLDVKMKRNTTTHVIFHLAMYSTKYHYFNGRTSLKHSLQFRKCKRTSERHSSLTST